MYRNQRFDRARHERILVTMAIAALATAWLGLLGAQDAHAQQKCTPEMTEKQKKDNAVAWWQQATKLYEKKRYKESIDPYQQAYDCAALLPPTDKATKTTANFLFNIAQAHRQLGECGPAVQRYKRYMELTSKLTDDKQVRDVRAAVTVTLDELEKTCPVDVTEQPATGTGKPGHTSGAPDGTSADSGQGTGTTTRVHAGSNTDAEPEPDESNRGANGAGGVQGASHSDGADDGPKLVSVSIGVGPAFVGMGDIDVPTQPSFALRAGYPMRLGVLGVEAGAAFTYTPVPWRNLMVSTSGTASLWSILLNAGVSYPILDKLSARGDVGLGALNFSGLAMSNPFTIGGAEPSGPLTMFNVRAELGLVYAITSNLVVNASPLVFSYSPADKSLTDIVGSLTRYELLIGAGYRM